MTKQEAIRELSVGTIITHHTYTPNEWMKLVGNNYVFEDGVSCGFEEFWKYRKDPIFNNGWEVYKEGL